MDLALNKLQSLICHETKPNKILDSIVCISLHTKDSPNECPGYDIKPSDGKAPVMLELWETPNMPSLPLLPGPLWPNVVALDRVLFMGQTELFGI